MKRRDIVLKNLAEEIKFIRHELLRVSKLDAIQFSELKKFFLHDFESIKSTSENLMQTLQEENPTQSPLGTILLLGNHSITNQLDLLGKIFKAGNKTIIQSKLNHSQSSELIQKSIKSVLDSQGFPNDNIQFVEHEQSTTFEADICVVSSEEYTEDLEAKFSKVLQLDDGFGLWDFVTPP